MPTHERIHTRVVDVYGQAHMKYSAEETSAQFRKNVNMVPWDIMR
jgi:hypothetical protein